MDASIAKQHNSNNFDPLPISAYTAEHNNHTTGVTPTDEHDSETILIGVLVPVGILILVGLLIVLVVKVLRWSGRTVPVPSYRGACGRRLYVLPLCACACACGGCRLCRTCPECSCCKCCTPRIFRRWLPHNESARDDGGEDDQREMGHANQVDDLLNPRLQDFISSPSSAASASASEVATLPLQAHGASAGKGRGDDYDEYFQLRVPILSLTLSEQVESETLSSRRASGPSPSSSVAHPGGLQGLPGGSGSVSLLPLPSPSGLPGPRANVAGSGSLVDPGLEKDVATFLEKTPNPKRRKEEEYCAESPTSSGKVFHIAYSPIKTEGSLHTPSPKRPADPETSPSTPSPLKLKGFLAGPPPNPKTKRLPIPKPPDFGYPQDPWRPERGQGPSKEASDRDNRPVPNIPQIGKNNFPPGHDTPNAPSVPGIVEKDRKDFPTNPDKTRQKHRIPRPERRKIVLEYREPVPQAVSQNVPGSSDPQHNPLPQQTAGQITHASQAPVPGLEHRANRGQEEEPSLSRGLTTGEAVHTMPAQAAAANLADISQQYRASDNVQPTGADFVQDPRKQSSTHGRDERGRDPKGNATDLDPRGGRADPLLGPLSTQQMSDENWDTHQLGSGRQSSGSGSESGTRHTVPPPLDNLMKFPNSAKSAKYSGYLQQSLDPRKTCSEPPPSPCGSVSSMRSRRSSFSQTLEEMDRVPEGYAISFDLRGGRADPLLGPLASQQMGDENWDTHQLGSGRQPTGSGNESGRRHKRPPPFDNLMKFRPNSSKSARFSLQQSLDPRNTCSEPPPSPCGSVSPVRSPRPSFFQNIEEMGRVPEDYAMSLDPRDGRADPLPGPSASQQMDIENWDTHAQGPAGSGSESGTRHTVPPPFDNLMKFRPNSAKSARYSGYLQESLDPRKTCSEPPPSPCGSVSSMRSHCSSFSKILSPRKIFSPRSPSQTTSSKHPSMSPSAGPSSGGQTGGTRGFRDAGVGADAFAASLGGAQQDVPAMHRWRPPSRPRSSSDQLHNRYPRAERRISELPPLESLEWLNTPASQLYPLVCPTPLFGSDSESDSPPSDCEYRCPGTCSGHPASKRDRDRDDTDDQRDKRASTRERDVV